MRSRNLRSVHLLIEQNIFGQYYLPASISHEYRRRSHTSSEEGRSDFGANTTSEQGRGGKQISQLSPDLEQLKQVEINRQTEDERHSDELKKIEKETKD
jgi:hypothetical protein